MYILIPIYIHPIRELVMKDKKDNYTCLMSLSMFNILKVIYKKHEYKVSI